jgi:hypothetical protein
MAPSLRQRAVDRRETSAHPAGAHNPLGASEVNANRSARSVLSRKRVHLSVRHHIRLRSGGTAGSPVQQGRRIGGCAGQTR